MLREIARAFRVRGSFALILLSTCPSYGTDHNDGLVDFAYLDAVSSEEALPYLYRYRDDYESRKWLLEQEAQNGGVTSFTALRTKLEEEIRRRESARAVAPAPEPEPPVAPVVPVKPPVEPPAAAPVIPAADPPETPAAPAAADIPLTYSPPISTITNEKLTIGGVTFAGSTTPPPGSALAEHRNFVYYAPSPQSRTGFLWNKETKEVLPYEVMPGGGLSHGYARTIGGSTAVGTNLPEGGGPLPGLSTSQLRFSVPSEPAEEAILVPVPGPPARQW